MLEFRLTELDSSPVYRHVIVESPVTHRGDPKLLFFEEQRERFAPWKDKILYVVSSQLTRQQVPALSPWVREHAQREAAWEAVAPLAAPDDAVLIADVDEIPSPAVWEHCQGLRAKVLMQRAFVHAVDWEYPTIEPCSVLAAAWVAQRSLARVRDLRTSLPAIDGAGWHFGWLGDHESRLVKLGVHCHLEGDASPEFQDEVRSGRAYREGWHAQVKLLPVDVDETWPQYIRQRRCPANWFRPRKEF